MSPHTDPLVGSRVKIERARKHLAELNGAVNRFLNDGPYRVVPEFDRKTNQQVRRVKVTKEIPIEFGAIIGDITHNLRSALDLMAHQLVLNNGNTPTDNTAFPIGYNRQQFKTKAIPKIQKASDRAIRLICRLKPYHGGNERFFALHEISITDKHKIVLTCGSLFQDSLVEVRIPNPDGSFRIGKARVRTQPSIFPLEDNMELQRFWSAAEAGVEIEEKFAFQIAFNEPASVKGQPIVVTLQQLINLTERTVEIFDRWVI